MRKVPYIISLILLLAMHSCMAGIDNITNSDPYRSGIIQGSVTDQNGNALERIRITIDSNISEKPESYYTSSEGQFRCEVPLEEDYGHIVINISIEDIDGEENGGIFETKSDTITIFEDDVNSYPIVIDLPTYRLSHATVSENSPRS